MPLIQQAKNVVKMQDYLFDSAVAKALTRGRLRDSGRGGGGGDTIDGSPEIGNLCHRKTASPPSFSSSAFCHRAASLIGLAPIISQPCEPHLTICHCQPGWPAQDGLPGSLLIPFSSREDTQARFLREFFSPPPV